MKIKEYVYHKSAQKTAKENNLILSENELVKYKMIFDFSLLDDLDIPEWQKAIIREDALKNIKNSNKLSYYGKVHDDFTACDGIAAYHVTRVFSSTNGKLLYSIFTLAKIRHDNKSRKSIYDNYYDVNTTEIKTDYTERVNDVEI